MSNKNKKVMKNVNNPMSWKQISQHLLATVFSEENLSIACRFVIKNARQYHKAHKRWLHNHNTEEFNIFKPLPCKGKYAEKLCVIPYYNKYDSIKDMNYIAFTIFNYRNRKYVAFWCQNNSIQYFRFHALHRYAERCIGYKEAELDDVFIGDMLIYNHNSYLRNYMYKGELTPFMITRDGGFIFKRLNEKDTELLTFIDTTHLFPNQMEVYDEGISIINEYRLMIGEQPLNLSA